MSEKCATCGAEHTEGRTCQSIFDEFLVLEFTDPGYGQVHFLTVACYMIQHNGYSNDALAWMESTLRMYLEHNLTGPELRKKVAIDPDFKAKKDIRRPKDAPLLPKVAWSMTIADVARQMYDAESYCKLITEWGHRTLAEMVALLQEPGN